MDGKSGIVRFNNGIRDFWRGDDGESSHHSIGVFFTDFADQESSHTSTGTSTERMCYLEALKTVTSFGFTSHNVQNLIN